MRDAGNDGHPGLSLPLWIADQVRNDGVGVVGFLFIWVVLGINYLHDASFR